MKYSEYILEYLEGILDREKEAELFRELASNEELRQEMGGQLLMARSIDTEIHELAPSPDVGKSIFEKMGFDSSSDSKGSAKPITFFWGGQFIRNLFSGLAGCAITAMLFLMFMPEGEISYPEQPTFTLNIHAPAEINYSDASSGKGLGSAVNNNSNLPLIQYVEEHDKTSSITLKDKKQDDATDYSETQLLNDDDNRITSMTSFAMQIPARMNSPMSGTNISNPGIMLNNSDIEAINDKLPGFAITHRNIVSSSTSGVPKSLSGNKTDFLSDRAFGAEIRIGDGHYAGVEVGRENYFLEYETGTETGKILHRQNPDLFWGGVFYKFVPGTDSPVKPYIRGFAGATSIGPTGRLAGGLNYRPFGSFLNLFIEAEGSGVFYQFEGMNYNSFNYGISYGISLSF